MLRGDELEVLCEGPFDDVEIRDASNPTSRKRASRLQSEETTFDGFRMPQDRLRLQIQTNALHHFDFKG
jgi:hypothetical protein